MGKCDISRTFATLRREIIEAGLCTRCGSCIGICPNDAVNLSDPLGECIPVANENQCVKCDAPCLTACPGKYVDFPHLNETIFGGPPEDYLLGHAPEIFVGYATDPEIRARAASGGAITAIVKHLLETGIVQGVACLIDDPAQPLQPRPVIATSWDVLRLSQQSKYSLAPMNTILKDIAQFKGPVAYVGLPDQVQSVRKLQLAGHSSTQNISLIIGSFCGAVNHFASVKDFLLKHGVRNLEEVLRIEYRAGDWPGKLRVTLRDGRRIELEKFYANYMNLFYVVQRTLFCVDLSNELADISVGDAWAPRYEHRHEGFSLVIGRTEVGKSFLSRCGHAAVIELLPTNRTDAIEMHSHGLFNKKKAVWSRIDLRKKLGKAIPQYGYRPKLSISIKIIGLCISVFYMIAQVPIARRLVKKIPLKLTGHAFADVRKRWRTWTRRKRGVSLASYEISSEKMETWY